MAKDNTDEWETVFDLNLKVTMYGIAATLPQHATGTAPAGIPAMVLARALSGPSGSDASRCRPPIPTVRPIPRDCPNV